MTEKQATLFVCRLFIDVSDCDSDMFSVLVFHLLTVTMLLPVFAIENTLRYIQELHKGTKAS